METKILSWAFSQIFALIQSNIFFQEKVEKLERLNIACENTINSLQKKNLELQSGETELKKKANLNSQNSNLPPSSDLIVKNKAKSLRNKDGNKKGGQIGHKGFTLNQVTNPNYIVSHKVESCSGCGHCLKDTSVKAIIKRQVFDIPPLSYEVTEHQLEVKTCTCCKKKVIAQLGGVNSPVQYGPRIKALASYLNVGQFIPLERLSQLFYEVFNLKVSPASIETFNNELSDGITPSITLNQEELLKANYKHVDESACRINGKQFWLHVLSNNKLTYYRITQKRGNIDHLQGVSGTIIHDHFKSYFKLDVTHGLCNAHHLRELNGIIETYHEAWAVRMQRYLKLVSRMLNKYLFISEFLKTRLTNLYKAIVDNGLKYHDSLPPISKLLKKKPKRLPGHNLLLRFKNFINEVLRCLSGAPFTNNQAEQDIRMIKLRQKISGCFRGELPKDFCLIRSYLSTLHKNKQVLLDWVVKAFSLSATELKSQFINLINSS